MGKELKKRGFFLQLISLDAFATTPSLNYRGKSHYTFIGFLMTIFMFIVMIWYTVEQISRAVTHRSMSSFVSLNPSATRVYYPSLVICLEQTGVASGSGIFTGDYSKYINAIKQPSNEVLPLTVSNQTDTKICVHLVKMVGVRQSNLLSWVINENEFVSKGHTGVKLTWTFPLTAVMDHQDYPIGEYPVTGSEQFDFTGGNQNIYYLTDQTVYFIERGFITQTTDFHNTIEYAGRSTIVDPRMLVNYASDKNFALHWGSSGKYNKGTISSHTITEVLANIGGLQGSLVLILGFICTQFVGFKYSENLFKALKTRGYIFDQDPRKDGNGPGSPEIDTSERIEIVNVDRKDLLKPGPHQQLKVDEKKENKKQFTDIEIVDVDPKKGPRKDWNGPKNPDLDNSEHIGMLSVDRKSQLKSEPHQQPRANEKREDKKQFTDVEMADVDPRKHIPPQNVRKDDEEIQISLWGYLVYKSPVGQVLRKIFPKIGANSKQRKQVEILESWQDEFDSSLDVVNVIGISLKTNNITKPRLSAASPHL